MAAGPPLTYGAPDFLSGAKRLTTTPMTTAGTPPGGVSGPAKAIPSVTVPSGDPSTLEIPSIYRSELEVRPLRGPGAGGFDVDPRLIKAVIGRESGGRNILGADKKSMGVMQVTADTARRLGFAPADMWDPQKNMQAGTMLLRQLLTKYKGDIYKTLAAYNAGEGAVDSGRIPASTQKYVQDIMQRLRGGDSSQNQVPAVKSGQVQEIAQAQARPLFSTEGPQDYQRAYQHNAPYATGGPYQTRLSPQEERQFRGWVEKKGVPFDPNAKVQDYDMRRFWKEQPRAAGAWQPGQHFPDTYKTPYDTTFSGESKYAKPGTPFKWRGDELIDIRTGQVIFRPPPKRTDPEAIPPDPLRQLLPQSAADRLTGGLKPLNRASVQEALQQPNIFGDVVRRDMGPRFNRLYGPRYGPMMTQAVATLGPLMLMLATGGKGGGVGTLEAAGETEDIGAAKGATELLSARPTTPMERPPPLGPPGRPTAPMGSTGTQYIGHQTPWGLEPTNVPTSPLGWQRTPTGDVYSGPITQELTEGRTARTESLGRRTIGEEPLERTRPALRMSDGTVFKGEVGESYPDLIARQRGYIKKQFKDVPGLRHKYLMELDSPQTQQGYIDQTGRFFSSSKTGELQYHGQAGKRPTEPLSVLEHGPETDLLKQSFQPRSVEPRFHGTEIPIGEMLNPEEVPGAGKGLLQGPGFYSTDHYADYTPEDVSVAGGYAGERQHGPGSGQVYRVYEIKRNMKFWDADYDLIPRDVLDEASENLSPKDLAQLNDDLKEIGRPADEWTLTDLRKADLHVGDELADYVGEQLHAEGYDGLKHEGGHVTGGRLHEVKIYWDPKHQIRLRQVKFRFPELPTAPPTVGHEWGTEVGRRQVPSAVEHPPPSKPISALERLKSAWQPAAAMAAEPPSLEDIEADKRRRNGAPPTVEDMARDKARRAKAAAAPPDESNAPWQVRAAGWAPTVGQVGGELLFGVGGPIASEGTGLAAESALLGTGGGSGYGLGLELKRAIRSHYGYPNPPVSEDAKEIAEQAAISASTPVVLRVLDWPIRLAARYLGPAKLKAAVDIGEKFTKAKAAYEAVVRRVSKVMGVTREEAEDIAKTSHWIKSLPQEVPNIMRRLAARGGAVQQAGEQRLREGIAVMIHEEARLSNTMAQALVNMRYAVRQIPEDVWKKLYGVERRHVEQWLEEVAAAQQSLLKYPAMRQALEHAMSQAPLKLQNALKKHVWQALGVGALARMLHHTVFAIAELGAGTIALTSSYAANSPPARALYRALIDQDAHLVYNATRALMNSLVMHYRREIGSYLPTMPKFTLGTGELVPRPPAPPAKPPARPVAGAGGAAAPTPTGPPTRKGRPSPPPTRRSTSTLEIPPAPPPPPRGAPPSAYNPEEERVFDLGGTE